MNNFSHYVQPIKARTSWFHLLPVRAYGVFVASTGERVYVGKEAAALYLCDHLIMAYSVGVHTGMKIGEHGRTLEQLGMVVPPKG